MLEEWDATPSIQAKHGRRVKSLAAVVMPDHFHGVLFVEEHMDVSVGQVICGFKTACTQRWRALTGADQSSSQPHAADDRNDNGSCPPSQPRMAASPPSPDPHRISRAQRARYYASLPRAQRSLFDDNYDDSFLCRKGQLQAMINRLARMEQLTLEERLANGYTALPYEPGTRTKVRYIDSQAWQHDRDVWINECGEVEFPVHRLCFKN